MKTAICAFVAGTVYLAAWVGINAGGIYPIGSQASYVAGGVCTINLEKDSDERFCPIDMPLHVPTYQLVSTLNECLEDNGLTTETAPEWVVPSHQECLRLHNKWRRKNKDD